MSHNSINTVSFGRRCDIGRVLRANNTLRQAYGKLQKMGYLEGISCVRPLSLDAKMSKLGGKKRFKRFISSLSFNKVRALLNRAKTRFEAPLKEKLKQNEKELLCAISDKDILAINKCKRIKRALIKYLNSPNLIQFPRRKSKVL